MAFTQHHTVHRSFRGETFLQLVDLINRHNVYHIKNTLFVNEIMAVSNEFATATDL